MAQEEQNELYFTPEQLDKKSEHELHGILVRQQAWAQQRFPEDRPARTGTALSMIGLGNPLESGLRSFAKWTPEQVNAVSGEDLKKQVHGKGQLIRATQVIDNPSRILAGSPGSPEKATAPTPPAKKQPEVGKVDGAGGQMSPAALEAVKKENEKMEAAVKAEKNGAKNEDVQGMLNRHQVEDKKPAPPEKKADTAAAPGAMTEKEIAKTQADFATDAKAAEIAQTQALLHMFGAYDAPDGSKAAAINGKSGPATRRALDNFAERVQRANPSLHFNSYEEIADQLRVEALANRETWQGTAENMKTSTDPFTRSVGEQVSAFFAHPENVPADRRPVLGSGVTRTVEQYQQPAPVETAATPAAPAPGQESTFEEPAFGFNDRGAAPRPSQAAFPLAARGQQQTPDAPAAQQTAPEQSTPFPIETSPESAQSDRPANNAAEDRRAANVIEALQRDPDDITGTNLGQILARSYRNDIAENRIRPGEPVLFEGDRKGRLFVAYGGQDGGDVTVKDITNFNDPRLGLNPLARDIASLAVEGRGGMVDNTTVPNAYAAAMDRTRQWQEQREQQRQQQLAQQQEWTQRQQQNYSSAPPSGWGQRDSYGGGYPPPDSYRGPNPGVSFRGRDRDMGPPPGWPGGHHHGHGGNFQLGVPGLLNNIFSAVGLGPSPSSQGDAPPTTVSRTNHENRFRLDL